MIPYMIGKLTPNSSHLTRALVKYVPGRGYFRAVPFQNGEKNVTSPPPPPLVERVTVHQTSLLHIESNLDPLGMLSPTHDQRSQQKNGKITLQPVLINKSKFLKATHCTEIRKIETPRSMVVEALSW